MFIELRYQTPWISSSLVFTAPSAAPEFLQSSETSTSILVQWRTVSCVELNSDPAGYSVHYRSESGGGDWNTISTEASVTTLNITGLTPYTNYSITVAVVNSLGDMGPYSSPISVQTLEDCKFSRVFVHLQQNDHTT